MFTGIITSVGTILAQTPCPAGLHVRVRSTWTNPDFDLGESIAIDGACMTVVDFDNATFGVEVSPESLDKTTLGDRNEGDRVNLERAMKMEDRFGGHFVSGHIDNTGRLLAIDEAGSCLKMSFELPTELRRYVISKGSITIDGISLTVNGLDPENGLFDVMIVPHTQTETSLAQRQPGDRVNLEVDLLGKYVERLLAARLTD
ncbi:MAG: riboflavin synthase [Rickettsiales bacterium]|nr:riboflavin synthase [Rickettsiales bacterium]|tara:strand:+ start:935 stop:1540 length:606 start_codon:yes stop_codon:yes gene_type:complete